MSPDAEEERRGGNNPAHAGKRSCNKKQHDVEEEQPRTRGEKQEVDRVPQSLFGTTPHARGKEQYALCRPGRHRNNPAHAGKMSQVVRITKVIGNNPAYAGKRRPARNAASSSPEQPRTRGEK